MAMPARRLVIGKYYHPRLNMTRLRSASKAKRHGHDSRDVRLPWASSVSLEHRLLLGDEGLIGALVVLGLHADRLRLRLGFDRLVDAHVPFLMQALLGHRIGEGRAVRQGLGQCLRVGEHALRLAQLIVEAPALGFGAVHGAAGIEPVSYTHLTL